MGQLITAKDAVRRAKTYLEEESVRRSFEVALGGAFSADEMHSQVYQFLRGSQQMREVLDSDPVQLMGAFLEVARLGLSLQPHMGHVAILPFRNSKSGGYDLVVNVMYRGWITMAHREGCVESITAQAVFDADEFDYQLGSAPYVKHRKAATAPGDAWKELTHAWCIGIMTPTSEFSHVTGRIEVLEKWEIDAIRARARGAQHPDSPWNTHPHRQAVAKVIQRWFKQAPTGLRSKRLTESPIDRAISLAEKDEAHEPQHLEENIQGGQEIPEDEMRALAEGLPAVDLGGGSDG